jgi:hypothetical protein
MQSASKRRNEMKLGLFSTALVAAAIIAAPAMAREHHAASRQVASDRYVATDAYAGPTALSCVPAPRVGAFATQPWTNEPLCQPVTGYSGY